MAAFAHMAWHSSDDEQTGVGPTMTGSFGVVSDLGFAHPDNAIATMKARANFIDPSCENMKQIVTNPPQRVLRY